MNGEERRELGTPGGNENESHPRITRPAAKDSALKTRLLLEST